MPLTPEDVSNKRFTPVRLREGYDMGEVDQFLDEVEAELARLTKENDDLRAKLAAAQNAAPATPTPYAIQAVEPEPEPEPVAPEPVYAPEPVAPVVAAQPPAQETLRVETVAEASNAAARLLEIATRNADELVDSAKNEADRIVGEARTKAERLESESKGKADRLEAEARQRAQMLDAETAERRTQMFGALETERDKLNGEVETLRSFEREYRSRLKTYFTQQLEALEGTASLENPRRARRRHPSACARSWATTRAEAPPQGSEAAAGPVGAGR
ncbi:DivIVA domain-containing protein [Nocardioides daphniae]|uniref:DivIVA domain-containing protein n=1 Tax=Nocardioides daphniae TaxID=402297 RepID=UPI003621D739